MNQPQATTMTDSDAGRNNKGRRGAGRVPARSGGTSAKRREGTRTKAPGLVNVTFARIELIRLLRNIPTLVFTAILPTFFYIIFGTSEEYGSDPVGKGNVSMVVMVTMAAYGAITATSNVGGMAAIERMQGWGRQLGLTPLSDRGYVAIKVTVALAISLIPVTLVFAIGALTGAKAPAAAWIECAAVIVIGSVMFALYGLCFGLALKSEAAMAAAGGSLVVLSFLGNVFVPLSGGLLTFARFTPMYGLISLVRYPTTRGWIYTATPSDQIHESIWIPLTNVAVWTLIFAVAATLLVRRGRQRG